MGDEGGGEEETGATIGSTMPLTSPYASDGGGTGQGITMAIDEYNEAGGVLGENPVAIEMPPRVK